MYLSEQGQAAFWRAGTLRSMGGPVTVTVRAEDPSSFQRLVGVRRQVWLGSVAATRGDATTIGLHGVCNRFVDHYIVRGPTRARRAAEKAATSG
jgi:hypothetical protein